MLVAALIVRLLMCIPASCPIAPRQALWPAECWHALPQSTLECLHGGSACSGGSLKGSSS